MPQSTRPCWRTSKARQRAALADVNTTRAYALVFKVAPQLTHEEAPGALLRLNRRILRPQKKRCQAPRAVRSWNVPVPIFRVEGYDSVAYF